MSISFEQELSMRIRAFLTSRETMDAFETIDALERMNPYLVSGIVAFAILHNRPVQHPLPPPSQRPLTVPVPPLNQETVRTRLTTAVAEKEECSITMTPIVVSSDCAVTPCEHVFNAAALQTWLTEKYTCPVCRRVCSDVSVAVGPSVVCGP